MPVIKLEFDDKVVSLTYVERLSLAVRDIVSEETGIKEVFVYANTALLKVQVDPLEIFVEMSASKVADADKLIGQIKDRIVAWKKVVGFIHPINLTLIPVHWKLAIGI